MQGGGIVNAQGSQNRTISKLSPLHKACMMVVVLYSRFEIVSKAIQQISAERVHHLWIVCMYAYVYVCICVCVCVFVCVCAFVWMENKNKTLVIKGMHTQEHTYVCLACKHHNKHICRHK